ncbi:hypothetical protein AMECASPLE_030400 [Ameca splendens]|uniref:Uncharacterized protein n=1 Tax=Ameca splendens TaxID=208324 RepID=A0ABV1AEG2_9TELE
MAGCSGVKGNAMGGGSRDGKKGIEHHCNLCHLLLILHDFKMQPPFTERRVGEENEGGVHVLQRSVQDRNRHSDSMQTKLKGGKNSKKFRTVQYSIRCSNNLIHVKNLHVLLYVQNIFMQA